MRRQAALWVLIALTAACGGGDAPPPGTLDREAFIATYVDLRLAALRSGAFSVTSEERDEILRSRGVEPEALLSFVDAYGRDTEYMADLWAEVDTRLTAMRDSLTEADAGGQAR